MPNSIESIFVQEYLKLKDKEKIIKNSKKGEKKSTL